MPDIDFELLSPSTPQANDAVLVRRGASPPNSGALTLTADLLARANHTGTQAATTISDFSEAVDDRVAALVVAGTNMTVTYNDAAGTLTFDAAGGGSPGGVSGEIQFNNAGSFSGASDVEIEGGQLRLISIDLPTVPVSPAAGGLKLFARSVGGRILAAIVEPSGLDTPLQPHVGLNRINRWFPTGNSSSLVTNDGFFTPVILGTATVANVAATNLLTRLRRLYYRVTVAATTAVVGWRSGADYWTVGGGSAELGGFHFIMRWMPDTGVTVATHRAFCGMRPTAAPTDVEPSTLLNMCGMGWDAADTNIQFMHNDGAGVATKINLGASFPVPSVADSDVYEIAMFAPPGTTQTVNYRVRNLMTGAVASGVVNTNLPGTGTFISPHLYMSVGGTSSIIGVGINSIYIESDY
jgi:hypothetical protein